MTKYTKEEVRIAKDIVDINTRAINDLTKAHILEELDAIANNGLLTKEEREAFINGNNEIRNRLEEINKNTSFFQSIVDDAAYNEAQKQVTK